MDERRAAAYRRLDEVVRELTAITEDESDDGQPRYTATDYVLIVGAQTIDNDGDRVGYVTVYPQGGSQPSYITTGLVAQARGFLAASPAD
ncbi:hypothetical protein [Mycobacteroides abscessus]|uniref:DUF7213 family protein n=1 Tax=Mycobacteroides abscessus TaxID=36809 RepID=UPI00092900EE|nr:hypothetical protein [Mycobacteroides abscessus]SII68392.1 Uncharacterised protein [Mycobacteroides abscessus subsp. abscessus]SIK82925.1 Uncharacterised protein [Mycobacteroides abscessus subsp. abscessus]